MKGQDKYNGQFQAGGSNGDAPMKNYFYTHCSRGEQDTSPDVVTDMLKVFPIDVYSLHYPGARLSFVTHLMDKKFDILPDILNEPFMVFTPVGKSVVSKRVHRIFDMMLPN